MENPPARIKKRVHRKARNGHNDEPGDRGANGTRLALVPDTRARAEIETMKMINRMNNFVLGEAEKEVTRKKTVKIDGKPHIEEYIAYVPVMTDSQVKAGLGLLRKTLPDLINTIIRGDPDNPLSFDLVSGKDSLKLFMEKINGRLEQQLDGSYSVNDGKIKS